MDHQSSQLQANHAASQSSAASGNDRVSVCLMIDRLSVAGTERQLLHLIDQIDQTRFQPHLCLLDGNSDASLALEPTTCPVLRLGVRRIKSLQGLRAVLKLAKYMRKHKIDIVQPYFPDSTFVAFLASRLAGVRHFVRNRRNLGYNQSTLERWLGKMYSGTSAKTATNSEACRQAIVEQESAAPDSVVVIPNGVDLQKFTELEMPRTDVPDPHIGMVANLRLVKDPMTLVQAAIELTHAFPKLRLSLAGEGPLREEIIRIVETHNLQDRFQLLGSVEDVPKFLESLDVAVLSSTSEGLSNSVIEYMAAARPIVVTNVGGNSELVEHQVSGLIVEPKNTGQFVDAIRTLITDRNLASQYGATARQQATEKYGLRQQAVRFEGLWNQLVQHG